MRFQRIMLVSIAVIYCTLSILYAILTPPWESPDEPAHYLYVSELATRWRPPQKSVIQQTTSFYKDQAHTTSNYEWYQPALGYLPAALIYKIISQIAPRSLPGQMPNLSSLIPANSPGYNIFFHPEGGLFQVWDGSWGLLIIRILLSFLGLPVIFAAHRLGNLLDKEKGFLGLAAAGWVAFLPQFTFLNASVRSDTLTNAIAALVILIAAFIQTSKTNINRNTFVMGILLGFGLISKNTFFYMLPVGLLAVILADVRMPASWLKLGVLVLVPALTLWGGYHLFFDEARTAFAYSMTSVLKINPALLTWKHLLEIPRPLLIDLFYARFGWANVATPSILSILPFGFWFIGFLISLIQAMHLAGDQGLDPKRKILTLMFLGLILALLGAVRFNLSVVQPQGRFLFPILLPWAILGFWGTWQAMSMQRQKIATILTTSLMLLFNIYALFFTLMPAYWGS